MDARLGRIDAVIADVIAEEHNLERVVHDADFRARMMAISEIDWAFEAKWSAADSLEIAEQQQP